MYPQEFSTTPGTGVEPVDGFLLFGLEPFLVLVLVLLVLLVAAGSWWTGRRQTYRESWDRRDGACRRIHKRILLAAREVVYARSDAVLARAGELRATIDDCLGDVLKVCDGVSGPFEALKAGLAGERVESDHGHGAHGGHGGHEPVACVSDSGPGHIFINPEQVVVAGRSVRVERCDGETLVAPPPAKAAHGHGHGHAAHHDHHPMTHAEQVAQVRAAVSAFLDHWADEGARVAELEAAQKQLTFGPAPLSKFDRGL